MFSCIVFCDVSKAFDRVCHKGFLIKLRQNGIEGKLLEWLNSYLSQRKQKVGDDDDDSLFQLTLDFNHHHYLSYGKMALKGNF